VADSAGAAGVMGWAWIRNVVWAWAGSSDVQVRSGMESQVLLGLWAGPGYPMWAGLVVWFFSINYKTSFSHVPQLLKPFYLFPKETFRTLTFML